MSNKVRRVTEWVDGEGTVIIRDAPDGDEDVPSSAIMPWEVWELAVETIRFNHAFNCHCSGMEPRCRSCRALAEIGGE